MFPNVAVVASMFRYFVPRLCVYVKIAYLKPLRGKRDQAGGERERGGVTLSGREVLFSLTLPLFPQPHLFLSLHLLFLISIHLSYLPFLFSSTSLPFFRIHLITSLGFPFLPSLLFLERHSLPLFHKTLSTLPFPFIFSIHFLFGSNPNSFFSLFYLSPPTGTWMDG